MQQTAHADERGPAVSGRYFACIISRPVCVRVWVRVFVHKCTCDELTVAIPLYDRDYRSKRNNPFNLVHLLCSVWV